MQHQADMKLLWMYGLFREMLQLNDGKLPSVAQFEDAMISFYERQINGYVYVRIVFPNLWHVDPMDGIISRRLWRKLHTDCSTRTFCLTVNWAMRSARASLKVSWEQIQHSAASVTVIRKARDMVDALMLKQGLPYNALDTLLHTQWGDWDVGPVHPYDTGIDYYGKFDWTPSISCTEESLPDSPEDISIELLEFSQF